MANSVMRRGMDAVPMRLTLLSRPGFFGSLPRGAPVLSSLRSRGSFVFVAEGAAMARDAFLIFAERDILLARTEKGEYLVDRYIKQPQQSAAKGAYSPTGG